MATELAAVQNQALVVQNQNQALEAGFASDVGFNLLWRGAKALAASTLVPGEFREKPANCMIALNMARHMGVDPLMCMQNLYIVHGRPAWSAQFMIACFNQCGRFTSIKFEFFGTRGKDDYGCRARATEKSTGEVLTGPEITVDMAKKNNWWSKIDKNGKESSKWPFMTEQMLRYRAASWFIRTIAPEIAMGFHTTDEIHDGVGAYDADAEIIEDTPAPPEKKASALDAVVDAAEAKKPEPPPAAVEPKASTKTAKNPTPSAQPASSLSPEDEAFMRQAGFEGDLYGGDPFRGKL